MHLYEETKPKIFKAYFVGGIFPTDYKVLYKNIFELFEYRTHAHSDDIFITFYTDDGDKISLTYKELAEKVFKTANLLIANGNGIEDRIASISHNHADGPTDQTTTYLRGVEKVVSQRESQSALGVDL